MTTAASTGPVGTTSAPTIGYAIPIQTALDVAHQIELGVDNSIVHSGEHGVLGVEVEDTNAGVAIAGVQSGSSASSVGLAAGDVISAVDGRTISTGSDLESVLTATHVGDRVQITWLDGNGSSHSATVMLTNGAA